MLLNNDYVIWQTDHTINQTVSKAVRDGTQFKIKNVPGAIYRDDEWYEITSAAKQPPSIAYGILRGTADQFRKCKQAGVDWWEIDNGYFKRGHFDGYYRISKNGLQATYRDVDLPADRLDALRLDIRDWQRNNDGHILISPPTPAIVDFYGDAAANWLNDTLEVLKTITDRRIKVRYKNDGNPYPLEHDIKSAYCVITFNSVIALDALLLGIPAIASPYCVVNSWNHYNVYDVNRDLTCIDREKLFKYLSYCQFTLDEFRRGYAFRTANEIQNDNIDRLSTS
jgi:hypothetical protein